MPATTTDGGRERELEDLGVTEPTVEWLDNDRVLVTMRRTELDKLIAGDLHEVEPEVIHDPDCDCYDDGWGDAIAAMRRFAEAEAAS